MSFYKRWQEFDIGTANRRDELIKEIVGRGELVIHCTYHTNGYTHNRQIYLYEKQIWQIDYDDYGGYTELLRLGEVDAGWEIILRRIGE